MAAVPAPYLQKALEGSTDHPAEPSPQTSGMTTAILLSYIETTRRAGGGRAHARAGGLLGRESELRDESTWWTFVQKQALMHAAADVLDDPQVTVRAGAYALEAGRRRRAEGGAARVRLARAGVRERGARQPQVQPPLGDGGAVARATAT